MVLRKKRKLLVERMVEAKVKTRVDSLTEPRVRARLVAGLEIASWTLGVLFEVSTMRHMKAKIQHASADRNTEGTRKRGGREAGVVGHTVANVAGKFGMLFTFSGVTVASVGRVGVTVRRAYARWLTDNSFAGGRR